MRSQNFTRGFAVAIVLGLAGCAANAPEAEPATSESVLTMMADYPAYSSAQEVVEQADLVVEVDVLSADEDEMYPEIVTTGDPVQNPQAGVDPDEIDQEEMGVPITVTTVEVLEVFKG